MKKAFKEAADQAKKAASDKAGIDVARIPAKGVANDKSVSEIGKNILGDLTGISSANQLGENLAESLKEAGVTKEVGSFANSVTSFFN